MGIFDFKEKQRLHTQLVGHTSGKEMFVVEEYNQRKRNTYKVSAGIIVILTMFFFFWGEIPSKFRLFMIIVLIGLSVYGYFNFKEQKNIRKNLY